MGTVYHNLSNSLYNCMGIIMHCIVFCKVVSCIKHNIFSHLKDKWINRLFIHSPIVVTKDSWNVGLH
jgi:hypothetical protein